MGEMFAGILISSGGVNLISFKLTRATPFGFNCCLETDGKCQNLMKAEKKIMAPEEGLGPFQAE